MEKKMQAKDKLIVALDVDTFGQVAYFVKALSPYVYCFKIGLQLITRVGGPQAVKFIYSLGGKVMFDGKFADIPNTMVEAAKAVADLKAEMFTVHSSSGGVSMRAAADNKGEAKMLAVTVLTSMSDQDAYFVFGGAIDVTVLNFAYQSKTAGADGVVCSPRELEFLRGFPDLMKVATGVRPTWAAQNDQKRTMTPAEAIAAGADYIIIGRPITHPPAEIGNPVAAAKKIIENVERAIEEKNKAG